MVSISISVFFHDILNAVAGPQAYEEQIVEPSMLTSLVCHELMLTGRVTVEYDAELYRVNAIAGCRGNSTRISKPDNGRRH